MKADNAQSSQTRSYHAAGEKLLYVSLDFGSPGRPKERQRTRHSLTILHNSAMLKDECNSQGLTEISPLDGNALPILNRTLHRFYLDVWPFVFISLAFVKKAKYGILVSFAHNWRNALGI